ncbi:hypothetical protein U91I_03329 [alpha proteobacterium U9-1i]|nr:hypothetical protein U91I_03329 [alpha proteobacterium U9-1i]
MLNGEWERSHSPFFYFFPPLFGPLGGAAGFVLLPGVGAPFCCVPVWPGNGPPGVFAMRKLLAGAREG